MSKREDITELQSKVRSLENQVASLKRERSYYRPERTFILTLRTRDGFTKTQAIPESQMSSRLVVPSYTAHDYCVRSSVHGGCSCSVNAGYHRREFRFYRQTSETEFIFEEV